MPLPDCYDTVDSNQGYLRGDAQDSKYLPTRMHIARIDAVAGIRHQVAVHKTCDICRRQSKKIKMRERPFELRIIDSTACEISNWVSGSQQGTEGKGFAWVSRAMLFEAIVFALLGWE